MRAFDRIAEYDYRLKGSEDDAAAAVFRLKPLTAIQVMEATELALTLGRTASRRRTLYFGLRGWSRLTDKDGEVPFAPEIDDNLARLTVEQIVELCTELMQKSKVTEAERKNLSSPPT